MRHYNIPVFVPHCGCPHDCIFCSQKQITGTMMETTAQDVRDIIDTYLSTILPDNHVEVAFFGGSFTGIEKSRQKVLLEAAYAYIKQGKVKGIRVSTRPDYISKETLTLLKNYGVCAVELGVQSMDDEVLRRNERGHTAEAVGRAVELLRSFDFEIGLQMMTGMYGSNVHKDFETGRALCALRPDTVRIYPTVVLKHTRLAELYLAGAYLPPVLEDTVALCARLYTLFEGQGVRVIRMGLQATDVICETGDILAGAYHSAFGELVLSRLARDVLEKKAKMAKGTLRVAVPTAMVSQTVGCKRENIRYIKEKYGVDILLDIIKEDKK